MSGEGDAPPLRALLIGIDRYLPPRQPTMPRYGHLYGCVRDVERMARWLERGLGVPQHRIECLVALHGTPAPPSERRREWPSYEGLVAAFERLIDQAEPGEHLWIHYSGHGGRVPTLVPERKGPLGLDECLVPWDIGDPNARYLRDVELAVLLERLERTGAFVTLVIDCCHAGGTARRGWRVRGVDTVDRTPRPAESLVASSQRLAEAEPRPKIAWRHAELPAGRPFDPTGYVLLAACRPGERTVEEQCDDGEPGGAFTRSLLRSLGAMDRGATYAQLVAAVGADVTSRFPGQTPVIEGEGRRPLLGGRELPPSRGVAVLGAGGSPGTVRLATGAVHGVAPGHRFAIEPPAAVGGAARPRRIEVEVVEAGAAVSEARAIETAGRASGEPVAGDRAILLPEPAEPRLHRARWCALSGLENREPGAFLRGRLAVTLERLPGGYRPGEPLAGVPFEPGTAPAVEVEEWVVLRVVNRAPEELNVAVLDLRSDHGVAQVFPAWRGGWFQPVDGGGELAIPLRAWLPDGMASATDLLLVLVTSGPVCHRWLEIPALKEAGTGAPPPAPGADPACEHDAATATAMPAVPGREPLDDGADGWIAVRLALEVVRRVG